LGILDKKKINLFSKEVLPSLSQFWDFLKTIILSSLCVILGFILFIIPGFYVSGRLLFALYISTEKNQGSVKTIKEAWKMTEGHGWQLFGKSFVIGLFVVLGFIALFVGSFITYPIGMIVIAMMYREFSKLKMNNISTSGKDKETEV
jgi:membrane-anchored glycerophosphoryl diester phosphodiesterase (GDPDase)